MKLTSVWCLLWLAFLCAPAALDAQTFPFTLDFEEGTLRGWRATGKTFDRQPTLDDNASARGRGPSGHQGRYWIGTYESYQGKRGERPGSSQGDKPQGILTSATFTIPEGTLSFLVGGGRTPDTRVELVIVRDNGEFSETPFHESGRNSETMHRVTWNLTPYAGARGMIRIVDNSSGDWGHINADDFRFSAPDTGGQPMKRPHGRRQPKVQLSVMGSPPFRQGQTVQFAAKLEPPSTEVEYRFDYGDGTSSGWTKWNRAQHVYDKAERYLAVVQVRPLLTGPFAKPPGSMLATDRVLLQVVAPSEPGPGPQPPKIGYKCVLRVKPTRTEAGTKVQLSAAVIPFIEDGEYLFAFDDGESSGWMRSGTVLHTYRSPGFYRPKVSVRRRSAPVATAEGRVEIVAVPAEYRVFLSADTETAEVGQDITFSARVEPPTEGVRYLFSFSDGRSFGWSGQEKMTLSFEKEGTYNAHASALVGQRTIPGEPVTVRITPKLVAYRVYLTVGSHRPKPGNEVVFQAALAPAHSSAEYRFVFGDAASSPWIGANETSHHYPSPGIYPAHVEARVGERVVAISVPVDIEVVAPPPLPPKEEPRGHSGEETPLKEGPKARSGEETRPQVPLPQVPPVQQNGTSAFLIVLGAAAVFALGAGSYAVLRQWKQPEARLGYVSHTDIGGQCMEVPPSEALTTEISLRPCLDPGQQRLDPQGSLVLSEERLL